MNLFSEHRETQIQNSDSVTDPQDLHDGVHVFIYMNSCQIVCVLLLCAALQTSDGGQRRQLWKQGRTLLYFHCIAAADLAHFGRGYAEPKNTTFLLTTQNSFITNTRSSGCFMQVYLAFSWL